MWRADGTAVQDSLGPWFTLLRLRGAVGSADALRAGFAAVGAPLAVLELPEPTIRDVYGADWLLLRPDLHVAWRGDASPPAMLARQVAGYG